jgi:hypothetical protein
LTNLIRSLIRETLLLEEVYGAQAVVYHGTKADPLVLIDALLKDKFTPGVGAGAMYGKGLYTVYDLAGTQTERGDYGPHVIKLKVNLYGYIIFDPDIALKVYKRPLTPVEQAEEVGYSESVVEALRGARAPKSGFTSEAALEVHESLQHEVKGLVFTGRRDGRVVVVYDPTTAVPMSWKRVGSKSWTPVDRSALLEPLERPDVSDREDRPVKQSALGRSALGDFEAGKWDTTRSVLKILGRLERLPEDQRVVSGDLDLKNAQITSLPVGLKVGGNLDLSGTKITSLPAGLKVGGTLDLSGTRITSLPAGLKVGWGLYLIGAPITSLPAGLKVGWNLDLSGTQITSLPADLQVGGDLAIFRTQIASLPADLKVGGSLDLRGTRITSLPAGLKLSGTLNLSDMQIASLPSGLQVGGSLYLDRTKINSLPSDLRLGGSLYMSSTRISSLPPGLEVGGNLRICHSPITSLPTGLKVGGYLDVADAPVTSLPADLKVGDAIYGLDRGYWDSVPEHLRSKLE